MQSLKASTNVGEPPDDMRWRRRLSTPTSTRSHTRISQWSAHKVAKSHTTWGRTRLAWRASGFPPMTFGNGLPAKDAT